jgi:hypothetical protein
MSKLPEVFQSVSRIVSALEVERMAAARVSARSSMAKLVVPVRAYEPTGGCVEGRSPGRETPRRRSDKQTIVAVRPDF